MMCLHWSCMLPQHIVGTRGRPVNTNPPQQFGLFLEQIFIHLVGVVGVALVESSLLVVPCFLNCILLCLCLLSLSTWLTYTKT